MNNFVKYFLFFLFFVLVDILMFLIYIFSPSSGISLFVTLYLLLLIFLLIIGIIFVFIKKYRLLGITLILSAIFVFAITIILNNQTLFDQQKIKNLTISYKDNEIIAKHIYALEQYKIKNRKYPKNIEQFNTISKKIGQPQLEKDYTFSYNAVQDGYLLFISTSMCSFIFGGCCTDFDLIKAVDTQLQGTKVENLGDDWWYEQNNICM